MYHEALLESASLAEELAADFTPIWLLPLVLGAPGLLLFHPHKNLVQASYLQQLYNPQQFPYNMQVIILITVEGGPVAGDDTFNKTRIARASFMF